MLLALSLIVGIASGGPVGPSLDESARASADTGDTDAREIPPPAVPSGPPESDRSCSAWSLADGVALPDLPDLYVRQIPDRSWGTREMIDVILAGAKELEWERPDADPILVGDISVEQGGYLAGHKSHRAGVDADIGIYHGDGRQHVDGYRDLSPDEFDEETTWLLIHAFLDTGQVEFILLDRSLIRSLREYLLTNAVIPPAEVDRILPPPGTPPDWRAVGIVRHAPNHRNHMHVRVLCADGRPAPSP